MEYFLDTEFIEDGKTIDLISLALVCEDGREYYAVSNSFDPSKASDWVLENVLLPMGINRNGWIATPDRLSPGQKKHWVAQRSRKQIRYDIKSFVGWSPDEPHFSPERKPEFWGYYADYDWVAFCQLFGTMVDLPPGFPMYCRDIKQFCDYLGNPKLPDQGKGEHHALYDARWNREAHRFLTQINLQQPTETD